MAQKFMHYNIVVSCPSDMVGDREKLQNAVAIVNEQNAHFRQMHFDIKHWQKDVLFGVGDPQLIINNSIIKNADMVIALFGSRLGAPTARATSGTIEEIEEMIKAGKQVFVCFSEKDITITASDSEEKLRDILKVREFQKNYKGLYITYRTDEELEEKITNQLRLFVGSIEEDREIYICDVPFTYQEVRGNRPGLENAKELIFIARTGKIFLGKHYNHINQMIKNGGKIIYVTSEDFNTVGDTTEYKDNQDTVLTILKRLKDRYPDRVNIGFLPTPVNITMYYLKLHDGTEYINVKFNFQTYHGNDKHPMFDLFPDNPMFPIFQHEIIGLQKLNIPIE